MMRFPRTMIWLASFVPACLGMQALAQPASPPLTDVIANPFAGDPAAPAAGKAVFESTCAACHGAGAAGSERAPALNTGTFRHGGSDQEIFQTIRSGLPGTLMPSFSGLPSDNVWRLVSYVKSLSGQTGPLGQASGDAVAGEAVFFGKGGCAGCHEINGRGLDLASDLSAEGTKPVAAIKTGVLHQLPQGRGFRAAPHYADVVANDGRTAHGLVRDEDSFSILLEDKNGKWLSFSKSDVKSITNAGGAQPRDIATRLSGNEVDNIVAFLQKQKARDFGQIAKNAPSPVLPYARLANARSEPQNWPTYWGDYAGHHFSDLDQITPANVRQLQAKWVGPMPPAPTGYSEATPLVVDGVMYVSGSPGEVYAFDVRTGMQKWVFRRKQDVKNPYQNNPSNKGLAVLDGRVFVGTLDDLLIAIDANTGRQLWEVRTADTMEGIQMSGAPLALDGKIITGMSGGELGARGYLDAYDPVTGKRLWRTFTIPAKGEPGNDSWAGDSWKTGGAPTWLTGSYDPQLHLLYWGTGNPAPDYNAESRKGDNLYSDCVLAIDPDTGKIKWFYQFTPNDDHDWDSTEDYVLADMTIGGKQKKVLLHADRNGVYYVIDRTNGQMLLAKPFVKTNWFTGFDKKGRPIVDPKTVATAAGQVVYPAVGGTNFQAPSYNAQSGVFFLEYVSSQGFAQSAPVSYEKGKLYLGRGAGPAPAGPPPEQGVMAMEASTGNILWKYPMARVGLGSGLVATKGGLVFVAGAGGEFIALDQKSGKPLWHFRTNGQVNTSPMSYAVDGKQYIAIVAANDVYSFALPD